MKTTLPDDVFYCFGFVMGICGFLFGQFWWIFGGVMIFLSPIIGKEADKHTKHTDGEFWID